VFARLEHAIRVGAKVIIHPIAMPEGM
jgi:hypothetical protein